MEYSTQVAIKAMTDGTATIAGYGVVFGGKDLYGETFTPETDFSLDLVPVKPVLYDHGMSDTVKHWIGKVTNVTMDEHGLWVEAELERNKDYVAQVLELVEAGALGWSSGTAGHLAQRTGSIIKTWPVIEWSLTPTPAEPRTLGIEMIKALSESDASFEALLPKADAATSAAGADGVGEQNEPNAVTEGESPRENEMETEVKTVAEAPAGDTRVVALETEVKALRDLLEREPAYNAPALNKTGLGDSEVKAVAHYLRTGDAGGMKVSNANDMTIADATYAGNTVPTGLYQTIIAKRDAQMLAGVLGVQRIPGIGTTTNVPYDNGTANVFVSTSETTAFDLDAPVTALKAFTLVKYSKQVVLSYELLQDNDVRLMDFLNDYIGRALALTHNSLLVTEALASGTSVTLGAVSSATATDIPTMIKNLKGEYADNAAFVAKRATQFAYLALTGNNWQFVNTPNGGVQSLWGYPVRNSESVAAIGSANKSIIFGNFNYMGLYESPSMEFLRDPYSKSGTGQIVLNYYFRAKYGVLLPEAILYGTHPTA